MLFNRNASHEINELIQLQEPADMYSWVGLQLHGLAERSPNNPAFDTGRM